MTDHINCRCCGTPHDVLEPDQVTTYLTAKGWTKVSETYSGPILIWSQWERELVIGTAIVIVPHAVSRSYYASSFFNAISELSTFEKRPMTAIIAEMKGVTPH
jgi:hypothetical protein